MNEPAFHIHQINDHCWQINMSMDNRMVATTAVSTQQEIGSACIKLAEAYRKESEHGIPIDH
jgi:hypothetical protein